MYSTCIFCHSHLGANASVEHFPVGRRLAFDVSRGRLWVVCRKCERWNLTPLEERWEAVEGSLHLPHAKGSGCSEAGKGKGRQVHQPAAPPPCPFTYYHHHPWYGYPKYGRP